MSDTPADEPRPAPAVDAAPLPQPTEGVQPPASDSSLVVDVPASASLAETLRTFGEVCHFPDYYGENLDALLDCLRDQPSLHVSLSNAQVLREADPEGYRGLVTVLRQARAESSDFHFAILR